MITSNLSGTAVVSVCRVRQMAELSCRGCIYYESRWCENYQKRTGKKPAFIEIESEEIENEHDKI